MTLEEEAVVQAAIAWRHALPKQFSSAQTDGPVFGLLRATDALIRLRDSPKDCLDNSDELLWVERAWVDVRTGDHVRLPNTDVMAWVEGAVHWRHWHTDPRSSEYRPQALDWSDVKVTFRGDPTQRAMDPNKPIEIELSASEVDKIEMLGWPNRLGMQIHDPHQVGLTQPVDILTGLA